jgi:hypothetical protein
MNKTRKHVFGRFALAVRLAVMFKKVLMHDKPVVPSFDRNLSDEPELAV